MTSVDDQQVQKKCEAQQNQKKKQSNWCYFQLVELLTTRKLNQSLLG